MVWEAPILCFYVDRLRNVLNVDLIERLVPSSLDEDDDEAVKVADLCEGGKDDNNNIIIMIQIIITNGADTALWCQHSLVCTENRKYSHDHVTFIQHAPPPFEQYPQVPEPDTLVCDLMVDHSHERKH